MADLTQISAFDMPYLRVDQSDALREVYNDFTATVQPYHLHSARVLWQLSEDFTLLPGESRQFIATMPDSVDDERMAYVMEWFDVLPVDDATWHDVGGSGPAAGEISVTTVKTATTAFITVSNNGTVSAHFFRLWIRGRPVTKHDSFRVRAFDQASQDLYDRRSYPLTSEWYSNSAYAQSSLEYELARRKDPHPVLTLALPAGLRTDLFTAAVNIDLSDRIFVEALHLHTMLGVSREFHVEAISHSFAPGMPLTTVLELSPVTDVFGGATLFQLNVSQLNGSDVLAH